MSMNQEGCGNKQTFLRMDAIVLSIALYGMNTDDNILFSIVSNFSIFLLCIVILYFFFALYFFTFFQSCLVLYIFLLSSALHLFIV